MTSLYFNGLIISALFLVIKFFEIRFVTKQEIPPKILIRDSVIVYISVLFGHYLLSQFGSDSPLNKKIVEVFTDSPSF
mgnify:CR=1 FL=1